MTSQVQELIFPNHVLSVGVAGIYDLRLLVLNNTHPIYREFTIGAFGEDRDVWDRVSPALYEGLDKSWQGEKGFLYHSKNDDLIDVAQTDVMASRLSECKEVELVVVDKTSLKEGHDEIWEVRGRRWRGSFWMCLER